MNRSPCPHLKVLHTFQPVQIWHQSDPVFQRAQELHLELHHLPEVPEQNVQLQHNTDSRSETAATLRAPRSEVLGVDLF